MLTFLAALPLTLGPPGPFATGSYQFTCDYQTLNREGQISKVDRVAATVTVKNGRLTWANATITQGDAQGKWGLSVPQKDLDGFSYRIGDSLFKPGLFQGFNDPEFKLRNLTWDTEMFREFTGDLPKLRTEKPLSLKPSNVPLGGGSTFKNTDIQLTLGSPESSGPVISYRAPGNTIAMKLDHGMSLEAVSTYYGKIWLRSSDKSILKATLEEDVAGTVRRTPAGDLPVHVVRKGTFIRG